MAFGAPATNATLPAGQSAQIEAAAERLEALTPFPTGLAQSSTAAPILNGSWRLLYSNAPEITTLASIPLGFQLGEVYQPIDVGAGALENQAAVEHSLRLASASTRVVASFRPAPLGTLNAAGVKNEAGNRLDVDFEQVAFTLERFLAFSTGGRLRKILSPRQDPTAARPAVDVTYLDDLVRITRGGDASLFVLVREESAVPLLSPAERARLKQELGEPVVSGEGFLTWLRAAVSGTTPA